MCQVVDWPRQSIPVHALRIPVRRWAIHVPAQCRAVRRQHLSVLRCRDHVGARLPALSVDRLPRSQTRESPAGQGRTSQADRLRIRQEARRQVLFSRIIATFLFTCFDTVVSMTGKVVTLRFTSIGAASVIAKSRALRLTRVTGNGVASYGALGHLPSRLTMV